MRILMVSSSYPINHHDWKSRFIFNMADAVARRDIELKLWSPPGELPSSVSTIVSAADQKWLARVQAEGGLIHLLRNRPMKGMVTAASLLNRLRSTAKVQEFDIAHVNWLQNGIPFILRGKPLLVTVLGSDLGLLRLPGMVFLLRQIFKRNKCILAPNAEWMTGKLQSCFGDVAEIRPIIFGVLPQFLDIERTPPTAPRWLAVSRITRSKIGKLFEWGDGFFGGQRELHIFGPMQERIELPPWVSWHGPTNPDELISTWFPQATGLITLSAHDEGRPQVMLEAMAASLPVIASPLPAHRDLIEHGKTGWIADSPNGFGKGLSLLEDWAMNIRMGKAAREQALHSIGTWDDCAARYEEAYRDLLSR